MEIRGVYRPGGTQFVRPWELLESSWPPGAGTPLWPNRKGHNTYSSNFEQDNNVNQAPQNCREKKNENESRLNRFAYCIKVHIMDKLTSRKSCAVYS